MIMIIQEAAYDTDYAIGYQDGSPVLIDDGSIAAVKEGNYIYNRGDGYYWYVENGYWRSAHKSYFGAQPPETINPGNLIWEPIEDEDEYQEIDESNLEQMTDTFMREWFPTPGDDAILDGPDDATINGLWQQFSYEREDELADYQEWWKAYALKLWTEKVQEMVADALSDGERSVTTPEHPCWYTYVASEDDDGYRISSHQDDLPAFMHKKYATLNELIVAMRKIAPLSRWLEDEVEE